MDALTYYSIELKCVLNRIGCLSLTYSASDPHGRAKNCPSVIVWLVFACWTFLRRLRYITSSAPTTTHNVTGGAAKMRRNGSIFSKERVSARRISVRIKRHISFPLNPLHVVVSVPLGRWKRTKYETTKEPSLVHSVIHRNHHLYPSFFYVRLSP